GLTLPLGAIAGEGDQNVCDRFGAATHVDNKSLSYSCSYPNDFVMPKGFDEEATSQFICKGYDYLGWIPGYGDPDALGQQIQTLQNNVQTLTNSIAGLKGQAQTVAVKKQLDTLNNQLALANNQLKSAQQTGAALANTAKSTFFSPSGYQVELGPITAASPTVGNITIPGKFGADQWMTFTKGMTNADAWKFGAEIGGIAIATVAVTVGTAGVGLAEVSAADAAAAGAIAAETAADAVDSSSMTALAASVNASTAAADAASAPIAAALATGTVAAGSGTAASEGIKGLKNSNSPATTSNLSLKIYCVPPSLFVAPPTN
ncbi:MAG TPA: hypothetical protein VJB68_09875, partial [Methylophilaceae bacterium]|nr:hypothetical protein [Methylophilaceae bacterium]